ncbi:MAG: TOBE domain-containing protein [Aigarchaeota archaeon]|nr:TOBE domain-containing protein [Aigarchaeota archaeon]MDW8092786.1 TOBE domain-containing protein [Nitrososphaerota archaeon]
MVWGGKVSINVGGTKVTLLRRQLEFLSRVDKWQSISKACREMGISYRTGLKWRADLERAVGGKLIDSSKGGRGGGVSTTTPLGVEVLQSYYIALSLDKPGMVKSLIGSRMSARNVLRGIVREVTCDSLICKVSVVIQTPQPLVALITADAARELDLREGDSVSVVLKALDTILIK